MSTLNVTTIAGLSGGSTDCNVQGEGSATTNLSQGLTKAYSHHTGDDVTVNNSFNISSHTDNGNGDVTYTWTNAFGNVYSSYTGMSTEDGTIGYVSIYFDRSYTRATGNVRLQGIDNGDSFEDGVYTTMMAVGDLA